MEKMDFTLSVFNYLDIPLDKYEKNFTFIVNDKQYKTSRLIADILSPNLRNFHYSDSSVNEMTITTKEPQSTEVDYFQDFLNLPILRNTTIDFQHKVHYAEYFYLLGNFNEFQSLQQENYDEITIDNAIDHLLLLIEIANRVTYNILNGNNSITRTISFISSNFYKFETDQLKKLPIEIINEIITNKKLQIQSENSLLSFLLDLYRENKESSFLFDNVLFECVSNELFEEFLIVFDINDINNTLWSSVCSSIFNMKKMKRFDAKKIERKHKFRYVKIDHDGENPSSESSCSSLGEMLDRLDFREGIPVGNGNPNYDNNIQNVENGEVTENEVTDEENLSPAFNNSDRDDGIFESDDEQLTTNGQNNDNRASQNNENRNNNNNGENNHHDHDGEIGHTENGDAHNHNDNDDSSQSDGSDNEDGFYSRTRTERSTVGNQDLQSAVMTFFSQNRNLTGENLTKTVNCLLQIAQRMAEIYHQNVPHMYLDPHLITVGENFEPNLRQLVFNSEEAVRSRTFIFDIFWAPEIIDDFSISEKSDVFSFAVLTFFMFTGRFPFQDRNRLAVIHLVKTGGRDTIPQNLPEPIRDLIEMSWQQGPESRPSFREIAELLRDELNRLEELDLYDT